LIFYYFSTNKLDEKQSLTVAYSAIPSNRLLVVVNLFLNWFAVRLRPSNEVICLPAPCIAIALLVVRRRRRPSECHANVMYGLEIDFAHKIGCHGNVP